MRQGPKASLKTPVEQRLSPAGWPDADDGSQQPGRVLGRPQRGPSEEPQNPLASLTSSFQPQLLPGKGAELPPQVAMGSPGHGENTQGCPGAFPPARVPLTGRPGAPQGGIPYLTLLRETPALSPLSICFQWLIQETHVLSIYLEKNE